MSEDAIVTELQKILTDDFLSLAGEGYGCLAESKIQPGEFYETISSEEIDHSSWHSIHRAVTRTPDNRLFSWDYEIGLTAYQEDMGPAEYGTPQLTEVEAHEETIVVVKYLPVKNKK